jgi:hypothetical protein
MPHEQVRLGPQAEHAGREKVSTDRDEAGRDGQEVRHSPAAGAAVEGYHEPRSNLDPAIQEQILKRDAEVDRAFLQLHSSSRS